MKFLANKKLATRIGIITTVLILVGMFLLWFIVSANVSANASATVHGNITNQLTDAVESRAAAGSGKPGAGGEGPAVYRGLCLC